MNYYGNLNGIYGIKTGFTNGANRCLVTACKRDDMDIICVVLGADTKNFRTKDSIKLIEYTFKNFELVNINNRVFSEFENWKNLNLNKIYINKGIYNSLDINYNPLSNEIIPIKKDLINSLKIEINCPLIFEAPLTKFSQIGCINIYLDEKKLDSTYIIIENEIYKKDIIYYFSYFVKNYCKILSRLE